MKRSLWFWLLLLGAAAWFWWPAPTPVSVELDAALDAPPAFAHDLSIQQPPLQTRYDGPRQSFQLQEFRITPVANFQLEARVLGRQDYRRGVEARLSPMDLALGWGPMARSDVLAAINIRQSNRFYFWRTENFPIPRREIETNSANMHLIPANAEVAAVMERVRRDDQIRLLGYLVNVDRDDGWRWRTSTTRNDTGNGACEIVLVLRLERL